MTRRVGYLGFALLTLTLPVRAADPADIKHTPRDFSFHQRPVSEVLGCIAKAGNFQFEIEKRLAAAKMDVNLKQIDPLDAFFIVSKIQELKVKRFSPPYEYPVRYVVTKPDTIVYACQVSNSRTFQLHRTPAHQVAEVLRSHFGETANVGIVFDSRTNRLLVRGTEEQTNSAHAVIRRMDPVNTAGAPAAPKSAPTPTADLDLDGI